MKRWSHSLTEIGGIAQMGVEVTHDGYHCISLTGTQITILDQTQIGHHVVYVASVFRQDQFFTLRVVVLEIHRIIC